VSGFAPSAERYRLRSGTGELVAIATDAGGGRLAPDKVLIGTTAPVEAPEPAPDPAPDPTVPA
jgi:hypothetical protein